MLISDLDYPKKAREINIRSISSNLHRQYVGQPLKSRDATFHVSDVESKFSERSRDTILIDELENTRRDLLVKRQLSGAVP